MMLGEGPNQDSLEFGNFHSYASRIIHLEYKNLTDLAQIDQSTCIRLLQSKIPFLPKLKSLKTSHHGASAANNDKMLSLLSPFLRSPFLESVAHLMPSNLTCEMGQFLSVLLGLKANIRTISLSGVLPDEFVKPLGSLRGLKVLSLSLTAESWTPALFGVLLTLELVEMSLDMNDADVLFLEQGVIPNFPSTLKQLSLRGNIVAIHRVLQCMAPQDDLESLSMCHILGRSRISEPNINCLYDAIAWFPTVRILSIDCANTKGDDPHPTHTSLGTGRLRSLMRLQSLSLKSLPSSVCFSDDDILSIAQNWPFLKVLCLEHAAPPSSTRPMFGSVCDLIERCPDLARLAITLDFGDMGYQPQVASLNLRHLDLQDTIINRPLIVARSIDKLCPNLLTFTVRNSTLCEQVREIIFDAFRPVRKDQQNRDFALFRGHRQLTKNQTSYP